MSYGILLGLLLVALIAGVFSLRWVVEGLEEQGARGGGLFEHEMIEAVGLEAQRRARAATYVLGALMILGILTFLVLMGALQRRLLDRMRRLVDVADAVAAGDRKRRADVIIDDELGRMGRFVNQALDQEQKIAALAEGRLAEQRELLVALVRRLEASTTIIGIDGSIIASTMSSSEQAALEQLTPEIRRAAKILLERKFVRPEELSTEVIDRSSGSAFSIRALVGGPRRVVGWLATAIDVSPREET